LPSRRRPKRSGEIRDPHRPLLPPLVAVVGGEHGRLQLGPLDRPAAVADLGDLPLLELDQQQIARDPSLRRHVTAEMDGQRVVPLPVPPGGEGLAVIGPVAQGLKLGREIGRLDLVPDADLGRLPVEARRRALGPGADVAEGSEIGEEEPDDDAEEEDADGGDPNQRPAEPRVGPKQAADGREAGNPETEWHDG
jgi:hypothetical protein